MRQIITGRGIILKKKIFRDNLIQITIFSKDIGKISLFAWGVKKITSRRISHLETGNYIKFTYSSFNNKYNLIETDLISAFSSIKASLYKLKTVYLIFLILDKILPQDEPEEVVFSRTIKFLSQLTKSSQINKSNEDKYFRQILVDLGYINQAAKSDLKFDPIKYIEDNYNVNLKSKFK